MSSAHRFERLDFTDVAVRHTYETAFYKSFERVKTNRLIHTLWRWDYPAQRLATRIPYEDQAVFAMRSPGGKVEAALAFNTAMEQFQSAAFGFQAPKEKTGCFEVLTFFNPDDRDVGFKFRLWHQCLHILGSEGFHTGYASTATRPLRLYLRIGWKLLEQTEIAGEQRFFLQFNVPARLLPQRVLQQSGLQQSHRDMDAAISQ